MLPQADSERENKSSLTSALAAALLAFIVPFERPLKTVSIFCFKSSIILLYLECSLSLSIGVYRVSAIDLGSFRTPASRSCLFFSSPLAWLRRQLAVRRRAGGNISKSGANTLSHAACCLRFSRSSSALLKLNLCGTVADPWRASVSGSRRAGGRAPRDLSYFFFKRPPNIFFIAFSDFARPI